MARKKNSSGEITGPRIRAVALDLFAQHGYAAVSMRQIAQGVGVQAGALYLYTPDKQSLLFDLMQAHLAELHAALAELPPCPDACAALEQFTRFHIRFHRAREKAVFIAYMELRNLEPENFARIEEMRRSYEAHLEGILQRGVAAGQFTLPDAKLAGFALIAMLTGVNTWYREGGRLSLERVEDIYWDMVRKAVGA
ncbi:TetR/AcrR family transcriptional regulator [Natronohydrobacter thiooxidans]|jgi:AcrR family transcriptional regulator|uniref:TetR/AcrR family transcriptional regulator n=1 Tax=Natronohydrobacter thiooxidans TaxID=87172 RepID=UPI0008FF202D|nr:TetR/AcrR family transcriptional regulator [Natronohydrobacter thiooxidans]